jgi:lipopolysaccharide/colanic/teichoic acid biosynthesis glycosyltransferase
MLTTSFPQTAIGSLDDCLALASPWGRWRLRTRSRCRKAFWRVYGTAPAGAKRTMDVVLSATVLLVFGPLFLLLAALIKLEDGGPVFFRQTRVGRHGRKFRMFKFRSMCLDAEQRLRDLLAHNQHSTGITFKLKDDPRITRMGRFLRKFSLDELPQFYNVLRGEMSLVGPRPPVPSEVAKYTLADRRRLAVKPGITCIWQISGRAEIDFPGQVRLDVNYIERQCLTEDVRILFKTVPAVLSGTGAY